MGILDIKGSLEGPAELVMPQVCVNVDGRTSSCVKWGWRVAAEYCEGGRSRDTEALIKQSEISGYRRTAESVHEYDRLSTSIKCRRGWILVGLPNEGRCIADDVADAAAPAERNTVRR